MDERLDAYQDAYGENFDYSFDNQIILNWYPQRIMQICPTSCSLLELGVGHGYTTHHFSTHFNKHLVIDGSTAVIQQFHARYPESPAELIHSYFEDFDTEEKYDVVVMGFVLEHVEDPVSLLSKYRNFLAPGGRCFIAVPNGESLHRRLGYEAGLLDNMMTLGAGDRELGHRRLYSLTSLSRDLEAAGYTIIHQEGIFLKPFTTKQLLSLQLKQQIINAMCEVGIGYPELSCALLIEATTSQDPLNQE